MCIVSAVLFFTLWTTGIAGPDDDESAVSVQATYLHRFAADW